MRLATLALMVAFGLPAWADVEVDPRATRKGATRVAPLRTCELLVSLRPDPEDSGQVIAQLEEKPLFNTEKYGVRCLPYAGPITWYVTHCRSFTDENCASYVGTTTTSRTLTFRPEDDGQHLVTAITGTGTKLKATLALHRKGEPPTDDASHTSH